MSVYKSKRSTSAIQYVENARQLQVFTIKNCVKFPKRYTYIVVQKIANLVEDIDTHVRVAESMMPTNAMLEWGRLIQKERDLITGVKKADRKRFKEKFKEYEDNSIPAN